MELANSSTVARLLRVLSFVLVSVLFLGGCDTGERVKGEREEAVPELPNGLRSWFPSPAAQSAKSENWFDSACGLPIEQLRRIRRGYYPGRSHDVVFLPRSPNYIGTFDYTTHGGPWDYLQRVPLVLYGPGYVKKNGAISPSREITVADIGPTMAELLDIEWPADRPGRVLEEALLPEEERNGRPRLVMTVVWDGGGTDVLRAWPDAWPHVRSLAEQGTAYANAIVGSAPSVTPPVHTTIGTGAFPDDHGIVDLTQRTPTGIADSFGAKTKNFNPSNMELSTVADLFDPTTGNQSKVGLLAHRGWHLGMMSQGSYLAGGDEDIAAIVDRVTGEIITSEEWYSLPGYMNEVEGYKEDVRQTDVSDGKADNKWMGRVSLTNSGLAQYTPAWTRYQTRLAEALLTNEEFGADDVPDLFFVNYKQIDDVGHYYNMLSRLMHDIVFESDLALKSLTELLDERVGRDRWVLVLTADHGETPDYRATGGWPIDPPVIEKALAAEFRIDRGALFEQTRTMGFWFDAQTLESNDITLSEIADFLNDFRLRDSLVDEEVPAGFEERLDERVFSAAFPTEAIPRVWRCATRRTGGL